MLRRVFRPVAPRATGKSVAIIDTGSKDAVRVTKDDREGACAGCAVTQRNADQFERITETVDAFEAELGDSDQESAR